LAVGFADWWLLDSLAAGCWLLDSLEFVGNWSKLQPTAQLNRRPVK
jgi:hypothetical protein